MNYPRFCLLAIGLILLALLAGCSGPPQEPIIKARFQKLAGHLARGESDACVAFVDPLYVRGQGTDAVKFRLGVLHTLFKVGNLTEADVRVDTVTINPDRKTAQVLYSLHDKRKDAWNQQPSMKWVLADGQWYWAI